MGAVVGTVVGAALGDGVGTVVGAAVGAFVGTALGDGVGTAVGPWVGDSVVAQMRKLAAGLVLGCVLDHIKVWPSSTATPFILKG